MAGLTPDQIRTRERIEGLIGLLAPFLNVVLVAGEQLSKIVEAEDTEYYPPRTGMGLEAPPRAAEADGGATPA